MIEKIGYISDCNQIPKKNLHYLNHHKPSIISVSQPVRFALVSKKRDYFLMTLLLFKEFFIQKFINIT